MNFTEVLPLNQFYIHWSNESLFYEAGSILIHRGKTWIASERVYYWDKPGVHPASKWMELNSPGIKVDGAEVVNYADYLHKMCEYGRIQNHEHMDVRSMEHMICLTAWRGEAKGVDRPAIPNNWDRPWSPAQLDTPIRDK